MNGGGFHQCSEVLVDRLFLGVIRLEKATQKHCRDDDVLVGPSELWGVVPPVHDVALDLEGVTPSIAHRVTRTRCARGTVVAVRTTWSLQIISGR